MMRLFDKRWSNRIVRWESKMPVVNDVQGRLLALVKSILDQNAIAANLEPATLLVDVGLTSMDMVNLMLAVEAEFDFTIPQADITPENFQSVETLKRLVVGQLAGATAAVHSGAVDVSKKEPGRLRLP
jgi:acyl carrier protein